MCALLHVKDLSQCVSLYIVKVERNLMEWCVENLLSESVRSLVVDGGPDEHAGNSGAGGVGDGGLGPDGSLEEGQEDVRDGLDGSEHEGVSASVGSGSKREGASLALWHVGGAKEVRCS